MKDKKEIKKLLEELISGNYYLSRHENQIPFAKHYGWIKALKWVLGED